jgi:hypothetical protein
MPVALAKRTYTLTRATGNVGLTSAVSLVGLGHTGNIVKFSIRLDATSGRATAGILYIADAPLASIAAIPSKDLVYQSGTMTSLVGSATAVASANAEADLAIAALPKGEPYILNDVNTPLNAVFRVTAVPGGAPTGATTIYLTIWAEVRS